MCLFIGSNPRDDMSHFVTCVSDDLVEECLSAILHDKINISRFMVHAQQVEESRLKWNKREFNAL